jgi:glycosyltransferase involved in cell wall biosynthesis
MKICIVTFNFNEDSPGGVHKVALSVVEALSKSPGYEIEIISFANSARDDNSVGFFNPRSYRNKRITTDKSKNGLTIFRIGSVFSELEIMRYRKRHELRYFFNRYDLLVVVTGFLQFANVIPKIKPPILVQCATRLLWERESQYSKMPLLKRVILYLQQPLLQFQEARVLRLNAHFLVENSRMLSWISKRSLHSPTMWYPGTEDPKEAFSPISSLQSGNHLISVGRLGEARKAWSRLFLSYKSVFDADPSIPELRIVGWGEFLPQDDQLFKSLQQRYPIKILANLSNDERNHQLATASFFVQTSHEEGLGLAAIEALSFGIPLICSETDGSREYVEEGHNGALVAQGSGFESRFMTAYFKLLKINYKHMSLSSRKIYESKFSAKVATDNLARILEGYLRNRI